MVQNGEGTVGKRARSGIGFSSRGVQCKRRRVLVGLVSVLSRLGISRGGAE